MKKMLNLLALLAMVAPLSLSVGCEAGEEGAYEEGAYEEGIGEQEIEEE